MLQTSAKMHEMWKLHEHKLFKHGYGQTNVSSERKREAKQNIQKN